MLLRAATVMIVAGMWGWLPAVLTGVAWYVAGCVWFPYTTCWCPTCDAGRHRSTSGRAWRTCRICNGSGSRLRLGRQLADWTVRG